MCIRDRCGTIQLDFQLPQRFSLDYIGQDGEKHRPIVIHRVIFGSIERFIGILIEHFAGKFPTWLAPVQVKVLPISNKFEDYSKKVRDTLNEAGIRVELDGRDEKIGYKIREARNERVPYMIVIGEKEENLNKISLRSRKNGDEGIVNLDELILRINEEVENKSCLLYTSFKLFIAFTIAPVQAAIVVQIHITAIMKKSS